MQQYLILVLLVLTCFTCAKDQSCEEDLLIASLELSVKVDQGLLLNGFERIEFLDESNRRMVFKSANGRSYKTSTELLDLVCTNGGLNENHYEVIKSQNFSIRYVDSLNAQNVLSVSASIEREDSLMVEDLDIIITSMDKILAWAPYCYDIRYDITNRKMKQIPTVLNENNPFSNIVFDTVFNGNNYNGVMRLASGWGNHYYNRYGILQFDDVGGHIWTINKIE